MSAGMSFRQVEMLEVVGVLKKFYVTMKSM